MTDNIAVRIGRRVAIIRVAGQWPEPIEHHEIVVTRNDPLTTYMARGLIDDLAVAIKRADELDAMAENNHRATLEEIIQDNKNKQASEAKREFEDDHRGS